MTPPKPVFDVNVAREAIHLLEMALAAAQKAEALYVAAGMAVRGTITALTTYVNEQTESENSDDPDTTKQ